MLSLPAILMLMTLLRSEAVYRGTMQGLDRYEQLPDTVKGVMERGYVSLDKRCSSPNISIYRLSIGPVSGHHDPMLGGIPGTLFNTDGPTS